MDSSQNETDTGRGEAADAQRVYAILTALLRLLPYAEAASPAPSRGAVASASAQAICHLALRAALSPALRPYLDDPLLRLGGQFISIDAQIYPLLAFAEQSDSLSSLLASLPYADRDALSLLGAVRSPEEATEGNAAFTQPAVGIVWGSLYMPAEREALPCRVVAVHGAGAPRRGGGAGSRWPTPQSVRSVSPDIAAAAQDALAAAVAVVERNSGALLKAPLLPGQLYFDVACPARENADEIVAAVAGNSLGLPLALAFLSALLGRPVRPFTGATGAVGRDPDPAAVLSVDWITAKAAAHRGLASETRFFVPAASSGGKDLLQQEALFGLGARPVSALTDAARECLIDFPDIDAGSVDAASVSPPVGERIAFLRTEIDGVVQFWEAQTDRMHRVVSEYEEMFRAVVAQKGGVLFGAGSELSAHGGLSAAFGQVEAAAEAALALQQNVLLHIWPETIGTLPIRIAIHRGAADLFRGDYYGPTLAQLGRLAEAANPGQILLSDAARRGLAETETPSLWNVTPLGRHRLRDLGEAMALHQLSRPGLPEAFDPPRTLDARRHNLPIQVTSFVGREQEVGDLLSLLLDDDSGVRLVTLYGPGGVGKTRLSLQLAAECAAASVGSAGFEGGVWFVPLAEARSQSDVIAAVAEAMRAPVATGSKSLADQVIETLEAAGGKILLLLDNLESALPDAAGFVGRLLRDTTRCTILVTSRMLLNLRGERRFEVPPLPVPSDREAHNEAALARSMPAVALFRARAREVSPGFDRPLDEGGSGEVSVPLLCSICRKLDGLPLAIELAAARARHLPLGEIERRLEDVFSLLVTRMRDVPERQRTLLGALQWSYDLLEKEEQEFLACLSVFAGGFTEEAARAVTELPDALDLLISLEEKSLVRCEAAATGSDSVEEQGRFSLLNMIQTFAGQRLVEMGRREAVARRHAVYYARLAQEAAPALDAPEEVRVFDALDREMDNLRAAYACLCATDPGAVPGFVVNVGKFARRRGHWREWFEWPRQALHLLEDEAQRVSEAADQDELLGWLHLYVATASKDLGDVGEAESRIEEVLQCADRAQESPGALLLRADTFNLRGLNMTRLRRFDEAGAALSRARDLYRSLGLSQGEARVLSNLGLMAYRAQEMETARRYHEEAAELCRRIGDQRNLLSALNNLAMMSLEAGDLKRARDLFSETLTLCRAQKDAVWIGIVMMNLGDALEQCGEADRALPLLVAAEQVFVKLGHPHRADAESYIARCVTARPESASIVAELRRDYARRTLMSLLATDAAPRRLTLQPQMITLPDSETQAPS